MEIRRLLPGGTLLHAFSPYALLLQCSVLSALELTPASIYLNIHYVKLVDLFLYRTSKVLPVY